jgi:ribosomal-protein-alanine N-acetyltransferase
MVNITYNKTAFGELLKILKESDKDFQPPLSTRVDIFSYCEKIFQNAQIIGAYDHNQITGIVCMYTNDQEEMIAFITSVCIYKQFRGNKIGHLLMEGAICLARESHMKSIKLEVGLNNHVAVSLYKKKGFVVIEKIDSSLIMELDLSLKGVSL